MLGLLDLLRAVKGTATLAMRRIHPVVGGVLVAVLWMVALGVVFTLARDDPAPAQGAASHVGHEPSDDDRSATTPGDDEEPGDGWSQRSEWAPADGGTSTTTAAVPAGDVGDLAAPAGSVPSTRPSTPRSDPSWRTSSTTSTTSTTAVPGTPSSTTTTTAPPSSGGLLGGLLDLLGLG